MWVISFWKFSSTLYEVVLQTVSVRVSVFFFFSLMWVWRFSRDLEITKNTSSFSLVVSWPPAVADEWTRPPPTPHPRKKTTNECVHVHSQYSSSSHSKTTISSSTSLCHFSRWSRQPRICNGVNHYLFFSKMNKSSVTSTPRSGPDVFLFFTCSSRRAEELSFQHHAAAAQISAAPPGHSLRCRVAALTSSYYQTCVSCFVYRRLLVWMRLDYLQLL